MKEKHEGEINNITGEMKDMKEKHEGEINNMKDKMLSLEDRIK